MSNKRTGRPVKKEEELLSHSINLKLTRKDYEAVNSRARKVGLSATAYARFMTIKGVVKNRFTDEELDILRKISGIANNLNQIARQANKSGLQGLVSDIYGIILMIKKAMNVFKKQ